MLDETVDTMALMMASYELDMAEQQLRDQGHEAAANVLQKIQIDAGFQHQALSEGLDKVSDLEACSTEVQRQINDFEPVTHERLKALASVHYLLPDGDAKDGLKALSDELAQNAPASMLAARSTPLAP